MGDSIYGGEAGSFGGADYDSDDSGALFRAMNLHLRRIAPGGDDLGDDILSIRQKAAQAAAAQTAAAQTAAAQTAAAQTPAAQTTAEQAPAQAPAAAAAAWRVSLDDERVLSEDGLEDRGLVAHIDRARATRAVEERAAASLPAPDELKTKDRETRQALSQLTTSLKDQQMAVQCACEEAKLQALNAKKLASGLSPHGYPGGQADGGGQAANLAHLAAKLGRLGDDIAAVGEALTEFERTLTLARRGVEAVVSGMAQHLDTLARESV